MVCLTVIEGPHRRGIGPLGLVSHEKNISYDDFTQFIANLFFIDTSYEGYPEGKFRLRILPLQRCGHDGEHVCRDFYSLSRHGRNLLTFEQCLRIVLCVYDV